MNNPQTWRAIAAVLAAYAALLGGLYAVVTKPLQGQLNGLQGQLNGMQGQINGLQHSMQSQLNDITERLARIEAKLDDHGQRIARLEERTSPIRR